jgi:CubicO group peptidase (beta-lactamase class C family)
MKRLAASLLLIIAMEANQSTNSAPPAQNATHAPADLNPVLQPILQKYDLPALAGAIVTSTDLIGVGAVGVRKYGSKISVSIGDQFHLGSDTKAMTATIIAMLVERQRLNWSTTLAAALPELAPKMDPAYRLVTLEQLLNHRAGFTPNTAPRGKSLLDIHRLPGSRREQRWAYAQMILREPPETAPGTKFIYSNRSYAIAGVIAEKAANKPWEELMRRWLFEPLHMESCGFGAMGTAGKLDEPLQHVLNFGAHVAIEPGPLADNPAAIAPAAAVHCPVTDWARFIQAHLRGEKGVGGILEPDTFKKLHDPPYEDYAFGWLVVDRPWAGGRALTHAGSNTQNYAIAWMAPLKDLGVVVMTNQGGDAAAKASDEAAGALIRYAQRKP